VLGDGYAKDERNYFHQGRKINSSKVPARFIGTGES